jgi:hypothetical protein
MANCEELLEEFWSENNNHNLMRRREKYIKEWAKTMNVHPPKFLFDEPQSIESIDVDTPSITSTDTGKKKKKKKETTTKQSTKEKGKGSTSKQDIRKTSSTVASTSDITTEAVTSIPTTSTTTTERNKKKKGDSSKITKPSSDTSHDTHSRQSSLTSQANCVEVPHTTVSNILSNISPPKLTPRQKEKMPEFIPTISSDEEEEQDVVEQPAKKRIKHNRAASTVEDNSKMKTTQHIDLSTPPSCSRNVKTISKVENNNKMKTAQHIDLSTPPSHNHHDPSTMPVTTISIESDSLVTSNIDYKIPKRVRGTSK